jgi:hypothetical protein
MRMIVRSLASVALVLATAVGCRPEPSPTVYYLGLSTGPTDADKSLLAGGDIGGRVLILVNGNPVDFYASGGSMTSLNAWVHPGRNRITIRGKHENPLFVKVFALKGRGKDAETTLITNEQTVEPSKVEKTTDIDFDVPVEYRLPIYAEGNAVPDDRERIKKEILSVLEDLHDAMAKHDIARTEAILFRGPDPRVKSGYLHSARDAQVMKAEQSKFLADESSEFLPFQPDSVQFVFGKHVVLVYAGFREDGVRGAYLFVYRQGEKLRYLGPHCLARIGGEWVIWK